MDCTTLAPNMAHVAVGARPCAALGHGRYWRVLTLEISADIVGFMQENSVTKRITRRLGLLTT